MANALLPSIQLFTNNQGGDSIRYENCQFNMKRKGKQAAYFKCITKDCQASLSLNVKDDVIIEPFNITNSNSVHKYESCKKNDKTMIHMLKILLKRTKEYTKETFFRVETNGLLATDTINCEICGQARGKRGYKIHLASCRKKSLK